MALTLTSSGAGGVFTLRGGSFGGRFQASVTPPPPLLLDTYPSAAAAYSLRKLRNAYTGNAIRVRRISDAAETNIGFVNGALDTTTLLTFVGASSGFVTTWYDQSGNGNHATQTSNTDQPQIVNVGVVITKNSLPSIYFPSNDSFNLTSVINGSAGTLLNVSATLTSPPSANGSPISILSPSTEASHQPWSDGTIYETFASTTRKNSIPTDINTTNLYLYNAISDTNFYNVKVNNLTKFSSVVNTVGYSPSVPKIALSISTQFGGYHFNGYISEIIVYTSNQNSNITGINTNINSYYSIY